MFECWGFSFCVDFSQSLSVMACFQDRWQWTEHTSLFSVSCFKQKPGSAGPQQLLQMQVHVTCNVCGSLCCEMVCCYCVAKDGSFDSGSMNEVKVNFEAETVCSNVLDCRCFTLGLLLVVKWACDMTLASTCVCCRYHEFQLFGRLSLLVVPRT